jgi:hypothetical protein
MNKSKMRTPQGNYLTQSLFLEIGYSKDAIYTLQGEDRSYKGKKYKSIKKIYLSMEDPIEYDFATKNFYDWEQWQRIQGNKLILPYIEEWRNELDLKLRSRAFKQILDTTQSEQGMVAKKWIADKGWLKNSVGRPSKASIQQDKAYKAKVKNEYESDIVNIGG